MPAATGAKGAEETKKGASELISVRIPTEEAERLQQLAAAEGQSVSEIIRRAVSMLLRPSVSIDRVSSNAKTMTVRHVYSSSFTEQLPVPDRPPQTVQNTSSTTT